MLESESEYSREAAAAALANLAANSEETQAAIAGAGEQAVSPERRAPLCCAWRELRSAVPAIQSWLPCWFLMPQCATLWGAFLVQAPSRRWWRACA